MKLKFYLKAAAVMTTLLFAATSCSEPENGGEGDSVSGKVGVEVKTVSDNEASVQFTPDKNAAYYFNIIEKQEYNALGSDQALVAQDLADIANIAQEQGKTVAKFIADEFPKSAFLLTDDQLASSTEYYAYAYMISANGTKTGEVTKVAFTTKAPEAPAQFAISISNVMSTTATVSVVPADQTMTYYFDALDQEGYNEFGGTPEAIATFMSEYIPYLMSRHGMTAAEVVAAICSTGDDSYDFEGLSPQTTYYAFAIGLDANGNTTTAAEIKTFTTAERQMSDMTFNIAVDNIDDTSAHIVITPSNNTETYFSDIQKVSVCDQIGSDQAIIDALITTYSEYISYLLSTGVYEYQNADFAGDYGLEPGTEYYVLTFGYDGDATTGLTKKKFKTTGTAPDPTETTFTFDIEVKPNRDAIISVTPSNNNVSYVWDLISQTNYNGLGGGDQAIKEYLRYMLEDYTIDQLAVKGADTWTYTNLPGSTTYYVFAIAVDAQGTPLGVSSISSPFTTPEAQQGAATVTISYTKYYDGDALYAADPTNYAQARGKAYIPTTITPSASAAHWYVGLYTGDYTDPASIAESAIISALKSQGVKDKTGLFYMATWDSALTYLGVAEDASGNTGTIFRLGATFTKSGVSPVSDLIGGASVKKTSVKNSLVQNQATLQIETRTFFRTITPSVSAAAAKSKPAFAKTAIAKKATAAPQKALGSKKLKLR